MNERIKQLADLANGPNPFFGPLKNHMVLLGDDAVKKFAELIVRECIDIVSPYAVRMENFDGGHPIADLKKHFGVEE